MRAGTSTTIHGAEGSGASPPEANWSMNASASPNACSEVTVEGHCWSLFHAANASDVEFVHALIVIVPTIPPSK